MDAGAVTAKWYDCEVSLEDRKFTRRDVLRGMGAIAAASTLTNDSMPEKITAQKEAPTAFEKKYGRRMAIGGTETETLRAEPAGNSGRPRILVAPGLGASIHTNSPLLEMLTDDGRSVLTLNHPSAENRLDGLSDDDSARVSSFMRTEVRKASNLLELLEKTGENEKVDCLAFSEGAINALIAAYLHPEKFNSIILTAPAGLIGSDNLASLMLRFRAQARSDNSTGIPSRKDFVSEFPDLEAKEKAMFDHIARTWKADEAAAWDNPLRSLEDLWAISTMRIDNLITFARAAGIKVAVVAGADDQIAPSKTMAERLEKDSLDGFLAIRGAHGPQYSARIVTYLFDLLGSKREKEERGKPAD